MQREIFEVYAKVVDSNGTYNTLSGYPKTFDSKNYDNDVAKAQQRAFGEFHACLGEMCKREDRQVQIVMIFRASDGLVIAKDAVGRLAEVEEAE